MISRRVRSGAEITEKSPRSLPLCSLCVKPKHKLYHMLINEITSIIIEESIYIHRSVGPGLFESVYEELLAYRLTERGLKIERQKAIPVIFENIKMEIGFRADLIVENKVVVEIKSVEVLAKVVSMQVLTYLRYTGCSIGLLINFNVEKLKDGVIRIANNYVEGT